MTYVELIVVLSIFSLLSSVAIFNYGDFQANVDIRNLGSDIALKIVEAQKSSLNGLLPASGAPFPGWKPSYGVSFYSGAAPLNFGGADNKNFIYFIDLNNNDVYDRLPNGCGGTECLNKISITKNNTISKIETFGSSCTAIDQLSITFKRPDSGAFMTTYNTPLPCTTVDYVKITVKSPKGNTTSIKVYPSGRIQIN